MSWSINFIGDSNDATTRVTNLVGSTPLEEQAQVAAVKALLYSVLGYVPNPQTEAITGHFYFGSPNMELKAWGSMNCSSYDLHITMQPIEQLINGSRIGGSPRQVGDTSAVVTITP